MSTRRGKAPSYRHHKPSGRAFVQLKRRRFYLGKHGTPASIEAYNRFLAEHCPAADGTPAPAVLAAIKADLTILELIDRYWQHAQHFYRRHDPYALQAMNANGEPNGEATPADTRIPTGTAKNQRPALRRLNKLYGSTPAAKFGPLALKAVRKTWVDEGLSIKTVNSYAAILKGVFQWAVSEELLSVSVYQSLKTVRGLERGRGEAHEPEAVGPVADDVVEGTLPHLPAVVADMVRFQRLTGCRPSEVCTIRPCDIQRWTMVAEEPLPLFGGDREQLAPRELDVWEYRPAHHKTKHKNRLRLIPIGPRARDILRPYLDGERQAGGNILSLPPADDAFCFRPADCNRQRSARRYTKDTYSRAIRRACELLYGMPEQLRKLEWPMKSNDALPPDRKAELRKEAAAWPELAVLLKHMTKLIPGQHLCWKGVKGIRDVFFRNAKASGVSRNPAFFLEKRGLRQSNFAVPRSIYTAWHSTADDF